MRSIMKSFRLIIGVREKGETKTELNINMKICLLKICFFFKNGTLSKGQTGVLNTHPGSVPAVAFKDCVRMVMSSIFAHSKPAQSLQVYFDKRPVVC